MKYNIWFRGAGGQVEAPNREQPVEAPSLGEVLRQLCDRLPEGLGLRCVGVRVEEVGEEAQK